MSVSLPKPLPPTDVPFIAPETGKINQVWREYLESVDRLIRQFVNDLGTGSKTVSTLPSASQLGAGARAFVTDASATTFHSTVSGGGSNKVPVVSDGTNWLIG
jgi:hypothetical protein